MKISNSTCDEAINEYLRGIYFDDSDEELINIFDVVFSAYVSQTNKTHNVEGVTTTNEPPPPRGFIT